MEKQQASSEVALIYCRIGSSQVLDGTGFLLQESACIQYALSQGFVVGRITREVSSESKLRDRPLLSRDRADVQQRLFAALIAFSPDRLSRDPRQVALLARECEQAGVALLFVGELVDNIGESLRREYSQQRWEFEIIRQRLGK